MTIQEWGWGSVFSVQVIFSLSYHFVFSVDYWFLLRTVGIFLYLIKKKYKNFEGSPVVSLLNFEGDPAVPRLNFRGIPGLTFKLWRGGLGSLGPEVSGSWSHFYTMPLLWDIDCLQGPRSY